MRSEGTKTYWPHNGQYFTMYSFRLVFNFIASPIQTLHNLIQFQATQFHEKEKVP